MKTDMQLRIDTEKERIYEFLDRAGVSDPRLDALQVVIEDAAFMRVKLEDSRELIKNSQIVMPYDNGGGQKGIRENPLFKGYEALFKSYLMAMDKIMSVLPKEADNALKSFTDDTDNVIEMVRSLKVKSNDRKSRAAN